MRLTIVPAQVLLVTVALITLTSHVSAAETRGPESDAGREIKQMQLPLIGGISIPSQEYDPELCSEAADDFFWDSVGSLIEIEWWGQYEGTPAPPDHFIVRFYDDVPGPPFSHPGNLLYEAWVSDYHEEYDPEYDQYRYYHVFWTDPFYPEPWEIHWISVQAPIGTAVEWGWCECDPEYYWNDEAVWDSQDHGVPRWTPMSWVFERPIELAFILHDGLNVAVEDGSWGAIKALYR